MKQRGLEFKVGLLIVSAIIILGALVFVLGNFTLGPGYELYVDFDYSGSVRAGAPVKVSGIKVGKVQDVEFRGGVMDERVGRRVQVRLTIWVESRVHDAVRKDAEFYINTSGVLGEQYVEIVPGKNFDDPPLGKSAIVRGVDPPRTDLVVSRLYDVLDSLASVLRDDRDLIRKLLADSASTVSELSGLLRDNRAEIASLISSTNGLAKEATVTLEKVNTGIGDPRIIGKTLRDADALVVTATGSIAELTPRAKGLLDDATRATGVVTEERVDRAIAVADKAAAAAEKAGGLIDNADGLLSDLRAGKGTAGALLAREEIYADLREMIRDLKRNPWKFFWKE